MSDLCAVVLSAGAGTRLRPITQTLPKPLCPVGNIPLLDRALHRLAEHGLAGPSSVAVNTSYLADQVAAHVGERAHISLEPSPPLGTSGALLPLRDWIGRRGVLAVNSDAYLAGSGRDLGGLLDGWDGTTVRVLTVPAGDRPAEFGGAARFAGISLLPADLVAGLPPGRSELVLTIWRPAERAGRLETVEYDGIYLDTGTPTDYLAANRHAAALAGGSLVDASAVVSGSVEASVIGAGAWVAGSVRGCVVLPYSRVLPGEVLVDTIRLGADVTVSGH